MKKKVGNRKQEIGNSQKLRLPNFYLLVASFKAWWRVSRWHKVVVIFATLVLLTIGTMYGIARWYIYNERDTQLTMGTSFIADYARYLGVDPHKTYTAILDELHVKHLRLVSYWSDIEPTEGNYDFSELDWEFQQAAQRGAKITLAIGLRQPRWPECHPPAWANTNAPESTWYPQLSRYMTTVINRYKYNPALQSYQLENEYFLHGFGACTNYNRQRLINEVKLVRQLDPQHTLIISRSDNAIGWPINDPKADEYGISIYRRVWDSTLHTHRYLEYPFPSWYYAFLAGAEKIWSGKDMIIHELQAEAWPPNGQTIPETSLAEQSKSIDAARLKDAVQFGKATGMKTIDLWGAEYWYYRKTILHDPSLWNAAQQEFSKTN